MIRLFSSYVSLRDVPSQNIRAATAYFKLSLDSRGSEIAAII
jgi:hypothetical protein